VTRVVLPEQPIDVRHFLGGAFESEPPTLSVRSPYDGRVIGRLASASRATVGRAVDAAERAYRDWRRVPVKERVQILLRFRELAHAELDALSHRAAAEAGKTFAEARAGVLKGLEVVEYAVALANQERGGLLEVSRGVTCETRREPLGVVAGIVPFNFPAMVPMWLWPIAIAAGNAFVLKPSEKVPLTSQLVAALLDRAGLPKGVFSLVNGGREASEALIDHPRVQAVGFVGSTPAARAVYVRATGHGKRALALGGAKNPLIVVPDADPAMTVRSVVDSFTGCAGQRCMAASLLIAVGDVEHIVRDVVETAAKIKLGDDMGAIIDAPAKERIAALVRQGAADGARLVLDGTSRAAPSGMDGGNWLGASILDHARPEMACARVEIFGPVLTIVRVPKLSDALALEAAGEYGNAVSVFTTSGLVARQVIDRAEAGMVGVNVGVPVPREPFSFGGTKGSKFGALDVTGDGGLELWTSLKKVTVKWATSSDHNWMS
jgi:malonate-semialdehyde dehydrogenase (acetylating)/methylmalonate-semialdehyde dehydrogenase